MNQEPAMQLESAYPVIVTDAIVPCRDFYVRHFAFQVVFESSWFIYLQSSVNPAVALAFMSPDHPSQPPGPEKFNGQGMFFTLQVADAAAEFSKVQQSGARIAYAVRDEPWGQRRFGLFDPAGTWVDVVQQIEPAPGFWDPYLR
jgi:catechol 2,3-dioxygenase-like lactoylglutathione lyase family enzyme